MTCGGIANVVPQGRSHQCDKAIQGPHVLALTHCGMVLTAPLGRSHHCDRSFQCPSTLTVSHRGTILTGPLGGSHQCDRAIQFPLALTLTHREMFLKGPLRLESQFIVILLSRIAMLIFDNQWTFPCQFHPYPHTLRYLSLSS